MSDGNWRSVIPDSRPMTPTRSLYGEDVGEVILTLLGKEGDLSRAHTLPFELQINARNEVEVARRTHQRRCRGVQQIREPSLQGEESQLVDDALFL